MVRELETKDQRHRKIEIGKQKEIYRMESQGKHPSSLKWEFLESCGDFRVIFLEIFWMESHLEKSL